MATITRRLTIFGRVQGVGFRCSLCAEARSAGLKGWVRNRSDGSVEALIFGPREAVDALTFWAYRGPPSARVERVVCNDEPTAADPDALTGFMQRPTF